MPHKAPVRCSSPQTTGIIKVVLLYAAFAALWILLSDKAVEWLFLETAQITIASTLKGWLFVLVTSLLLYGLMRRLLGASASEPSPLPTSGLRSLLPLALIAMAVILLTAGSIIQTFKHERNKEMARLQAISELKAGQLTAWLKERDGDSRFILGNQFFADSYRQWMESGDIACGEALKNGLNEYREDRSFAAVLLIDGHNRVLWSSEGTEGLPDSRLQSAINVAAAEGKSLRLGPYRDSENNVRIDLLAPLLHAGERLKPVVVLRTDPGRSLFSALQSWPIPSESGETVLFMQDGDEVLYLNELRHGKGAAATLRKPLAEKELLEARVLRGDGKLESLIEGVDYRGTPVMGIARAIPGTDWRLAAKVDQAEALEESYHDALWISLAGVLALFIAAAGSFLFRKHQELVFSLRERETQAAKLRALQLLDAIAESSSDAIFAKDREGRYLLFNRQAGRFVGKDPREVLGRNDTAIFSSEQASRIAANDQTVMDEDRTISFQEDLTTAEGMVTFLATKGPLHDADGKVIGMFGISRDITERKRAEETLRESEAKFRLAFQTSPDPISLSRFSDGTFLDINEGFTKVIGYTREEIIGKTAFETGIWVNPQTREKLVNALKSGGYVENMEAVCRTKEGGIRTGLMSARLLRINQEDVILSIIRDITDRVEAEKAKELLESQLLHSQKMESIGRLAGGVAHDFNNMLGVIIGRTEMAMAPEISMDELQLNLEEIHKAAMRSADLTRQLLAFARKQTAIPKILDLNETISGMLMMLRRLIGEDITLAWMPGPDLWKVRVDPSQIDQILANLTVNARDAIPGQGSITLSTEKAVLNDPPDAGEESFVAGKYVLLTMSDTGSGMDKDILEHIFEPFFTTKQVGHGTGLGLATVYGIVKQNNGFLTVSSKPGEGTTFRIYLPVVASEEAAPSEEAPETARGGSETILLVEDDQAILDLSKMILEKLGYTVLAAQSPTRALSLAGRHPGDIHLLITDVVMPELNGRDLMEKLLVLRPRLKCLFMSGYTADVIAHRGILEEGVHFIQKPFSMKTIVREVREALDA